MPPLLRRVTFFFTCEFGRWICWMRFTERLIRHCSQSVGVSTVKAQGPRRNKKSYIQRSFFARFSASSMDSCDKNPRREICDLFFSPWLSSTFPRLSKVLKDTHTDTSQPRWNSPTFETNFDIICTRMGIGLRAMDKSTLRAVCFQFTHCDKCGCTPHIPPRYPSLPALRQDFERKYIFHLCLCFPLKERGHVISIFNFRVPSPPE